MNYIQTETNGQMMFTIERSKFLMIPSQLVGFHNFDTTLETTKSGRDLLCFKGSLDENFNRTCSVCDRKMHSHGSREISLRHLCFGSTLTVLKFAKFRLKCPHCGITRQQEVPFQAENHRITIELFNYARDILSHGTYTLRQVAEITGLDENTIKAIDIKRLKEKYTVNGQTLIKPEAYAEYLGIDEFKLHDGHKYATHIIDLKTGHILWIAHGKKKKVVFDFIDHVGLEWMDHVEAIACDMNSDFQEAFEAKCPHIQPVFDYFHIVKNFNDKVVSEVRKDEQCRLAKEGNVDAARALKRTKYILTSSRATLERKDREARDGKVISRASKLFNKEEITRKEGYLTKYEDLLEQNKLLFTVDLVKEKLTEAYQAESEPVMAILISDIMDICKATGNKHFLWFQRLLDSHFEGIIAHATFKLSSGKIEGINNKIKTLRRQGYGYPDDEYFFLKLFDISRKRYVRNIPSHKILE